MALVAWLAHHIDQRAGLEELLLLSFQGLVPRHQIAFGLVVFAPLVTLHRDVQVRAAAELMQLLDGVGDVDPGLLEAWRGPCTMKIANKQGRRRAVLREGT